MLEPYRAFISDRLPKDQLARGFLIQSIFVGLAAVLANLSLLVFQKVVQGGTAAGIPYWVFAAFWRRVLNRIRHGVGALHQGDPPTDEELAKLRAKPKGAGAFFSEIASAVKEMPVGMPKIGLVLPFQWFAMAVYWQFIAVSMGETIFNATPGTPEFEDASGWVGAVNGMYNPVTIFAASP
jgi:maltose/moltooligosaccharide transporter